MAYPSEFTCLRGRRVLIVEDEMLLAMDLEALLEEAGCHVLGSIPDVQRALEEIFKQRPEVVLLDMNLNGDSSTPIAAALRAEAIPFLVVTGYSGKHSNEPMFRDAVIVKKPYDGVQLLRTLNKLVASPLVGGGSEVYPGQ